MIDWPAGIERTPPNERRRNNSFDVSVATARSDLETQMDRLDPDEWRAETGSGGSHVYDNGLPKSSANPDDPGVVVRWADGNEYAVACDRWTRLRDNLRSVGLWIKETRMRDQRPVSTARDSFAAARLPSGDPEEAVVAREAAHEVLGVGRDADREEIETAYRAELKSVHPDQGGSRDEFERVKQARDTLLGGDNQ